LLYGRTLWRPIIFKEEHSPYCAINQWQLTIKSLLRPGPILNIFEFRKVSSGKKGFCSIRTTSYYEKLFST